MDAELMTGYLAYSGTPDIVAEVQYGNEADNIRVSWFSFVTLTFVTTVDH